MKRLLSVGLVFAIIECMAQTRVPAFEMAERLGRGVNMGNCFEAPSEAEWGNPWKPEYFKIISELGFDHVRLPVRWEPADRSMATAPYTINATFLERIQQVVDTALKYKLQIIVNMHHHEALFENPAAQKARFLSQWYQIADHFKGYSDSLLFEVLNEPHDNITPAMWNQYFADALVEIRKTNPTRAVLMGVAEFGGLGAISQLQLPNDEYIIVTPHYYNPFPFTHQGADWVSGSNAWLGTKWLDTEAERETVETEFTYALSWSEANHVPIYVGEFGAYSAADIESRERWTTFIGRWLEEKNLSWAYWEFSSSFGIYNPSNKQYNDVLVDALLHNEMPETVPVYGTSLYTSNFTSGADGWSLSQQGGASGSISASAGKLNVSISAGGTEGWHLQLTKGNIRLEKDNLYRISFTASAEADRSLSFYAGKATSPWNAYSGASAITIGTSEATYKFTFTMTSLTDAAARLVFDLGRNASDVVISNVKVEKLSFTPPVTVGMEEIQSKISAYPNPVSSYLIINDLDKYHSAELFDLKGQAYAQFEIVPGNKSLNFRDIPAGVYVLSLKGARRIEKVRIIKENK